MLATLDRRFHAVPSRDVAPLFVADWTDAVFVHFAMDPRVLQPHVPFELDLYGGKAYVSLVAFTQERLRPRVGGRLAATLSMPLATHHFLNVRTYVRVGNVRGIYFLCEWIPNRLAALLGPPLYGLPYRLARLGYIRSHDEGTARHKISAGDRLTFDACWDAAAPFRPVPPGTLDEFLLERYDAFTWHHGSARRFHVWHEPWPQCRAHAVTREIELLKHTKLPDHNWIPVSANYSPGVRDVALSQPARLVALTEGRRAAPRRLHGASLLATILLPALAIAFGRALPAWQYMWLIALSLYVGCKLQTWWPLFVAGRATIGMSAAYLLAWVGMDAVAFLDVSRKARRPHSSQWLKASAVTICGAVLVWIICPLVPATHPLLVGWTGMLGLILLLHFGSFDLLSLAWRRGGIDAHPLMNRPLAATSLADFWGRRWNTAFHTLANRFAFRPLLRISGPRAAVLGTFFFSGLIHDLVISMPARGGYGLPTLYFTVQGMGVLIERRAGRGRVLTILFTLGPVFLLFHPPFITRVIVPFLAAIRAIPGGMS